jgi:hypothetical protein
MLSGNVPWQFHGEAVRTNAAIVNVEICRLKVQASGSLNIIFFIFYTVQCTIIMVLRICTHAYRIMHGASIAVTFVMLKRTLLELIDNYGKKQGRDSLKA